jgi:hypothetical protein
MAQADPYHTDTDSEDPVYHIYDDCPAGERVIADGNDIQGTGGIEFGLCKFCKSKRDTGKF